MTYLTVPDVAANLHMSPWTLREKARAGQIRGAIVAGKWLFTPEDVAEYVESQTNRTPTRRRRRRAA